VPDDEVAALFGQDFEVQQLEGMVPQGLPARFEDLNTHKAVWQMVRR
jgi:hypothetical protein